MIKYQDVVLDPNGNIVSGASVTVYNTGTLVKPTIYSDDGVTEAANPLTSSATGSFAFYVADGDYDIVIAKAGFTTTTRTDTTIGTKASTVSLVDAAGKYTGTNVETALTELKTTAELAATTGAGLIGIADALNAYPSATVEGALQDLATPNAATKGAKIVGLYDVAGRYTGTDVEAALTEVKTAAELAVAGGAALIGTTPAGTLAAATVQAALNELDTEKTAVSTLAATGGAALVGADDGASGSLWTTVQGFINKIISSVGSSVVGFIQSGASAVASTIQRKAREHVSVTDWMTAAQIADAVANTGSIDLTTAFSNAAKECPAQVNIQTAEGTGIARAPMARLDVPPGKYLLSSLVDTGGREVTWVLHQGAVVSGYANLNGKVVRDAMRIVDYHHGTADYATTLAVRAHIDLEDGAEILGLVTPDALATYADRDSVTLFVDNLAPPATIDVTTATYTATTIVPGTALTADQRKQLRVGMIIDTKHATKFSGFITAWAADGTSITVSNWYLSGGGAGTPANGTGANVNPFTKIWAHNANVQLNASSLATAASGFELGVLNNKAAPASPGAAPDMWGFDCVSLGTYKGGRAFTARGPFFWGMLVDGADTGYLYRGAGSGIALQNAAGTATAFSVNNSGQIEMGFPATAGTSLIDMHSSGASTDNDARISCTGGDATVSNGVLTLAAGRVDIQSGEMIAATDNTTNLGNATHRFNTIYASNNVINTSDAREKRDIEAIDTDVACALLSAIEAKTYRWNDIDLPATYRTERVTRQKTVKAKREVTKDQFEVVDGKAILTQVTEVIEVDDPVFEEYPVVDANGQPVMQSVRVGQKIVQAPKIHRVPVMEDVDQEVLVSREFHKKNTRRHLGFVAQEVESALEAVGVNTADFAAFIKDEKTGKYGLRYDQMLVVMWPVVQSLLRRVAKLESVK